MQYLIVGKNPDTLFSMSVLLILSECEPKEEAEVCLDEEMRKLGCSPSITLTQRRRQWAKSSLDFAVVR